VLFVQDKRVGDTKKFDYPVDTYGQHEDRFEETNELGLWGSYLSPPFIYTQQPPIIQSLDNTNYSKHWFKQNDVNDRYPPFHQYN